MPKSVYVYELPSSIVLELESILDLGNAWNDVAREMPDISNVDIDACRRQKDGRCTESLLKIWGSKGYRTNDLYKIFGKLKLIRCMQVLKDHVDINLHFMEQDCLSLPDTTASPKPVLTHDGLSYGTRPSDIAKPSDHTQPSGSVYSKKTVSGLSSLGDIDSESVGGSGNVYIGLQNTLSVKYDEILMATHDFSVENILGRGGYGTVYKGEWKNLMVAVKRIQSKKDSGSLHEKERLRQSLQELRTLAKFRHDNILSLYGYSLDGPEPCLVYQFMANGSLEDRLLCRKNTAPLNWNTRFQIIRGVSCGLHFLHSIGKVPVIHGDVKSANILLDKHMEPKLGDFGLCRDGQVEVGVEDKNLLIASHIKGTLAYLPPEFISSKVLTTKLDVYSFGVVMLEVASGLRAYSDNRAPHGLVDFISKQIKDIEKDGSNLKSALSDKKLNENDFTDDEFNKFLHLGLHCSHKDRLARPCFHEVLIKLNKIKFDA